MLRYHRKLVEFDATEALSPQAAFVKLDLRRDLIEAYMSEGFREALDELRDLLNIPRS